MAQKRQFDFTDDLRTFSARFPGQCGGCGDEFVEGDPIRYNASHDIVGADCCDGITGAEFDNTHRGRAPGIAVLPRGKTGKDRCGRCFIVHASGQVECE